MKRTLSFLSPLPCLAGLLLLGLALAASGCSSRCRRGASSDTWPAQADAPWRTVLRAVGGRPPAVLLAPEEPRPTVLRAYGLRSSDEAILDPELPAAPDLLCGRARVPIVTDALDPAIALLGSGPRAEIPKPAVNTAALVERAQWRLEQAARGEQEPGKEAGARAGEGRKSKEKERKKSARKTRRPDEKAEALPEIRVRSLVKTRRDGGPPVMLVSGDAECEAFVAVLDRRAKQVLAFDRFHMPGPRCAPLVALPPADLDGDGAQEVAVRSGDGDPGTSIFRGVYRLTWKGDAAALVRVWGEGLDGRCVGE
jgi:hypothetical protein